MNLLTKKIFSFEKKFDFNSLSDLLDRDCFGSSISSNWSEHFVMESVFKIRKIENDEYFLDIFKTLNDMYNKKQSKSDLFLFFSLVSGNKSITHWDNHDVYIIGLYGKTLYKVEKEEYIVEEGDLLFIPNKKIHKAIGITPRICLSFGIY